MSLPNVNEVVGLEVTDWQNGEGKGILLRQPQHARILKSGSIVTFTADALMDYKLSNPEGELETGGVDDLVRKLRGG